MSARIPVLALGAAAAGYAVYRAKQWWAAVPEPVVGRFDNGMEYARWGDRPRHVLWIPGGPGSDAPHGAMARIEATPFQALLDADYSVWQVTRRRNMPPGHTVEDMANDYAQVIAEEFGGRVDVVVGLSYGGMIAQYLAARHPERVGRIVLALSAARISDWGRDVDRRWAAERAAGNSSHAGLVMAEYVFPKPDQQRQRQLVGPLFGGMFNDSDIPADDLLIEAEAELAFDARDILPDIEVPVLLVAAEHDLFFTPDIITETAELIPDCTVAQLDGVGHIRGAMGSRLAHEIVQWLEQTNHQRDHIAM